MMNIDERLGKRIISNLDRVPEIAESIEALGKICDDHSTDSGYSKDGGEARERIIEWAYVGCVISGMNDRNCKEDLKSYVEGIREALDHNRFSDPVFYVQEVFNRSFK